MMEHPTRIGKYNIEEYLGGGMSHVYRATDSVLGRRVAVKVLTEAATQEAESKARFLQEARLASNISHDNIISHVRGDIQSILQRRGEQRSRR